MRNRIGRVATAVLVAAVTGAALTGCTGSSSKAAADKAVATATTAGQAAKTVSPSVPALKAAPKITVSKDLGVPVTGDYGAAPKVKLPSGPAPKERSLQVLHEGSGSPVTLGQLLVAQYQITTWGSAGTKPQVLDDAFARKSPVAVVVGARQALDDWDAALVGRTVGSRVLLLLPGTGGASAIGRPKAVVVDILAVLPADIAAGGAVVQRKDGLPEVVSGPGRRPTVKSVAGITDKAASQLVLSGTGPAVAAGRTLVLHVLRADASTGRTLSQTWGGVPMLQKLDSLQQLVPALAGAKVGSRAVAVLPAAVSGGGHPEVLVLDVLGQV